MADDPRVKPEFKILRILEDVQFYKQDAAEELPQLYLARRDSIYGVELMDGEEIRQVDVSVIKGARRQLPLVDGVPASYNQAYAIRLVLESPRLSLEEMQERYGIQAEPKDIPQGGDEE